MALQTVTTIKIGETIINNFSNLQIVQKIHDHHTFSIEVRQDLLVSEFESAMPVSQRYFGEKISIDIKPLPGLDDLMIISNPNDYILQFSGIVTNIKLTKSRVNEIEETILIQGFSRSIILDNGAQTNSFTQMTIADIASKIKTGYDIDLDIQPFFKEKLAYTVQYNESDFEFLNRLSKRHGQWFFDNGHKIVLGYGGSNIVPKLAYGINMHNFYYDMKLVPSLFKVLENDNRSGESFSDNPLEYRNETDGAHQNYINKSNQVFNKETTIQINQNAVGGSGNSSLEEYSKNKIRASMGKMMEINASSEVPGITVGGNVRITGVDKWLESSYNITQITHICDDGGGYENQFTAVNISGAVFSPETNPDLVPYCKSQTAVVIANADPDGLSGVKVQMPWQEAKGETTPYIPLLQKYGGDARGSHIIPEIGDTVFIDFQGNNAELPIVIGTMTSTKEKSGYSTPNNDLKVLETRSGNKLILDDNKGDITIESKMGQTLAVLYGDGNIKFKAPKNIELEAGEDVFITAGRNVKIEAKENIGIDAGSNINQEARNNILIKAEGNIIEKGDEKMELIDEKITINSAEHIETAYKINLNATNGDMTLKASKTIHANSGENSNFN
ncbi:type IV secretion protein Rhs [Flavobacterium sp. HMWF030]|nr:type IV secretion protein Rhs [Flavobacterium sp. HMWF030]